MCPVEFTHEMIELCVLVTGASIGAYRVGMASFAMLNYDDRHS